MTKLNLREAIALVLGCETGVGRSAALQLARAGARVILAGFGEGSLQALEREIVEKRGTAIHAWLGGGSEAAATVLRERREVFGHVHLVVETLTVGEKGCGLGQAREALEAVAGAIRGRGALRIVSVVETAPAVAEEVFGGAWLSVIETGPLAEGPLKDLAENPKPAAVAETALWLLQCPPGACPLRVRVEPRALKWS